MAGRPLRRARRERAARNPGRSEWLARYGLTRPTVGGPAEGEISPVVDPDHRRALQLVLEISDLLGHTAETAHALDLAAAGAVPAAHATLAGQFATLTRFCRQYSPAKKNPLLVRARPLAAFSSQKKAEAYAREQEDPLVVHFELTEAGGKWSVVPVYSLAKFPSESRATEFLGRYARVRDLAPDDLSVIEIGTEKKPLWAVVPATPAAKAVAFKPSKYHLGPYSPEVEKGPAVSWGMLHHTSVPEYRRGKPLTEAEVARVYGERITPKVRGAAFKPGVGGEGLIEKCSHIIAEVKPRLAELEVLSKKSTWRKADYPTGLRPTTFEELLRAKREGREAPAGSQTEAVWREKEAWRKAAKGTKRSEEDLRYLTEVRVAQRKAGLEAARQRVYGGFESPVAPLDEEMVALVASMRKSVDDMDYRLGRMAHGIGKKWDPEVRSKLFASREKIAVLRAEVDKVEGLVLSRSGAKGYESWETGSYGSRISFPKGKPIKVPLMAAPLSQKQMVYRIRDAIEAGWAPPPTAGVPEPPRRKSPEHPDGLDLFVKSPSGRVEHPFYSRWSDILDQMVLKSDAQTRRDIEELYKLAVWWDWSGGARAQLNNLLQSITYELSKMRMFLPTREELRHLPTAKARREARPRDPEALVGEKSRQKVELALFAAHEALGLQSPYESRRVGERTRFGFVGARDIADDVVSRWLKELRDSLHGTMSVDAALAEKSDDKIVEEVQALVPKVRAGVKGQRTGQRARGPYQLSGQETVEGEVTDEDETFVKDATQPSSSYVVGPGGMVPPDVDIEGGHLRERAERAFDPRNLTKLEDEVLYLAGAYPGNPPKPRDLGFDKRVKAYWAKNEYGSVDSPPDKPQKGFTFDIIAKRYPIEGGAEAVEKIYNSAVAKLQRLGEVRPKSVGNPTWRRRRP